MPDTNEGDAFRQLLEDLRGILSTSPSPTISVDHVYMRATAGFDPDVSPPYAQLVPGSANIQHPDSGVGEVWQSFEVALFVRMALDEYGRDTGKMTNESLGLLALRSKIRGDGDGANPSGLIHSRLGGNDNLSVFPIVLTSWSVPIVNPGDPFWIMATDTYRLIWSMY